MSPATFYIAACSEKPDGGIYRYEMRESAAPVQTGFTRVPNANWITFSPDRRFVYTTCMVDGAGGVASFLLEKDGSLTPINTCAAGGKGCSWFNWEAAGWERRVC